MHAVFRNYGMIAILMLSGCRKSDQDATKQSSDRSDCRDAFYIPEQAYECEVNLGPDGNCNSIVYKISGQYPFDQFLDSMESDMDSKSWCLLAYDLRDPNHKTEWKRLEDEPGQAVNIWSGWFINAARDSINVGAIHRFMAGRDSVLQVNWSQWKNIEIEPLLSKYESTYGGLCASQPTSGAYRAGLASPEHVKNVERPPAGSKTNGRDDNK